MKKFAETLKVVYFIASLIGLAVDYWDGRNTDGSKLKEAE